MLHRFLLCLLISCCTLCAVPTAQAQGVEELEHSTAEADRLLQQAQQASSLSERVSLAEQSLKMARDLRHDGAVVRASMLLAAAQMQLGKNEEALQHYLEAESKKTVAQLPKSTLVEIYTALGDLFFREKIFQSARRYYGEALRLRPDDAPLIERLAESSLGEQKVDTAELYYAPLLNRYRQTKNFSGLVKIYQKLAQAHEYAGNLQRSLANYLLIADVIDREGDYAEEAALFNNLGRLYTVLRAYDSALRYFKLAEDRCAYIQCEYQELLWTNLGIALHNTGDTRQGILYLQKARSLLNTRKDAESKKSLASLEHLLATMYLSNNDLYNALSHNETAIELAKSARQPALLAATYNTAADIHRDLYDFEKAFGYYLLGRKLQDSVRVEEQTRQQRLNQQSSILTAAEGQIKYLLVQQNLTELAYQQSKYEQERLALLNDKLTLEANESRNKTLLLEKQKQVDDAALKAQQLEAFRAQQELRIYAQNLSYEKQERVNAELRRQVDIDRAQGIADSIRNAQEYEILRRDRDISDLRYRQQARVQKFAYWIGALMLLILGLLGMGFLFARRASRQLRHQNRQIQAQNAEIQEERTKSDRLLTNILPEEIAAELKSHGYAVPRNYQSATVLFTDFVNFTKLSAQLTPEQIIDELNECFLAFDEICERHGLEKIKTIGDAYMCAGGLPLPNATHPADAVRAAIEMRDWLQQRQQDNPQALLSSMRIGIHTGPVVAGVIGKNKFAFDIWGDAVNLAARLEEHGAAGKINISKATAEAVRGLFTLQPRGELEVYNKGLVEMYFVER
ncbi:MAG TPA: adenylate/guanylate cyclase domain-containing protein [Saprospiraceae bacterium]|nr:adenylate/guanylate cyclase domain-containing protein [Saprospiraceae bacterium]